MRGLTAPPRNASYLGTQTMQARWKNRIAGPGNPRSPRQGVGFLRIDEVALLAGQLVGSRRGARRLLGLQMERAWGRAVGEPVRVLTRLRRHDRGVLTVDVPDASWKKELDRLKPRILSRLSGLLPDSKVERIEFQVQAPGSSPGERRQDRPVARHRAEGPASSLSDALAPVAGVEPEESGADRLAHRLGDVMRRYLARSKAC
ncbi:MAG: DUF721 domain-containing protein [Acidobacteriota bacterium]